MAKRTRQAEAISHIRELLLKQGVDIPSRSITLKGDQGWAMFEHHSKQLGIDADAGVWVRESELDDWRCLAKPCTVSGAIQAVGFLIKD